MFFDPEITNVLRDALPWAESFFRIITEFGAETIFVVIIFTGYWAYKKKESMQVGFLLFASVLSNYWLKVAIANPRPLLSYRTQRQSLEGLQSRLEAGGICWRLRFFRF